MLNSFQRFCFFYKYISSLIEILCWLGWLGRSKKRRELGNKLRQKPWNYLGAIRQIIMMDEKQWIEIVNRVTIVSVTRRELHRGSSQWFLRRCRVRNYSTARVQMLSFTVPIVQIASGLEDAQDDIQIDFVDDTPLSQDQLKFTVNGWAARDLKYRLSSCFKCLAR